MSTRVLASVFLLNGLIGLLSFLLPADSGGLLWTALLGNTLLGLFVYRNLGRERQAQLDQARQESRTQERNYLLKSSQLETVVNNLPYPLALLDSRGIIVLSNRAFRAFNTSTDADLKYDHPGFLPEVRGFIRLAYLKESDLKKNLKIGSVDYQASSIPIYDTKRFNGSLLMFWDITQILEGERRQKRFIADASHELKTPLSAILGMVQILNRPDFEDVPTRQEFMQQIEHETQRMDTIIQDLLVLSKLSAQKVLLDTRPINLVKLVNDSYSTLRREFTERNDRFVIEIDPALELDLDRDKFHQVFTNLLSNALKFTENGIISVSAERTSTGTVIRVKDTGLGIKPEEQRYIFDRFFRSDPSRSRGSGGSGLGLAIVKSYVLAHKGEIEVESQPGQGATFIIRLP